MRTIGGGTEAGDGGLASAASIRFLQGVTTDALGNIYISDADDHRVRKIDSSGKITTLAGDGIAGFSGDGGPASRARVNTPYGLSVSPLGELIFADLGNARVRRIRRDGFIETIAGGGTREVLVSGQFTSPREVKLIAPRNVLATPSGSVFISDFGANRILEIRSDGYLTLVAPPTLSLRSPAGMALDAEGNLLVADSGNARVQRIKRDGMVDTLIASSRELNMERPLGLARRRDGGLLIADTRGDFLWEWSPLGKTSIVPPGGRDVAVDAFENVLTAGWTWLRRVNKQGLIEILIGNSFATVRGDGGPALAARLNRPVGVATDSKGNIYFSDTGNHRVRRIDSEGIIATVAGMGEPGFRGDGALATQALLNNPTYLAVDSFDNVYVSDSANQRVRVFSPAGIIQTIAGTGRNEFSSDNIVATQASLASPSGLAFDRSGNLFIAERGQHRIRRISTSGRISTVAGTSIRGSFGDGQDALQANLNAPGPIAIDAAGNLFIGDSGNQSIRLVEQATGKLRTLVGELKGAEGLAVSTAGTLYFTESQLHRVQQLSLSGELSTIAGRARENGFNADSGDALALTLNEPAGIAFHPDGSLILADRLNDRLRKLEPPIAVLVSNAQSIRIVHGASFTEGAIAPGQLLSIFGLQLTRPDLAEVTMDGMAAAVSFADRAQLNFQAPYGIAGRTRTQLELRMGGALIHRAWIEVQGAAPALFESGALVIAVGANGQLNSDASPAFAGDLLTLYGTGEGLQREVGGFQIPFLPFSVEIAGIPADLLYAGAAPGFPGLLQVNLRLPGQLRLRGRVPIVVKVGAFTSVKAQFVAVQ